MNVELPLDGMTWGDLRAFVALGAGIDDSAAVEVGIDTDLECIDSLRQSNVILSPSGRN